MYEYRELEPTGDPSYTREFFDFGEAYEEMLDRNPGMSIVDATANGDERLVAQYESGGEEARILRREL